MNLEAFTVFFKKKKANTKNPYENVKSLPLEILNLNSKKQITTKKFRS